jgi:hypothetical protein
MDAFAQEMRDVIRAIDDYTEAWVEGERDERKWKAWIDLKLMFSRLPPESYDFVKEEAENKKRWELHLKGLLENDEFEVKA